VPPRRKDEKKPEPSYPCPTTVDDSTGAGARSGVVAMDVGAEDVIAGLLDGETDERAFDVLALAEVAIAEIALEPPIKSG
jgi:hypothetical protein